MHEKTDRYCLALSALVVTFMLSAAALAQTSIETQPSRDITISDDGSDGAGTGIYISTGTTDSGVRQRTLMSFDDLSDIPADMVVLDATLELFVNLTRVGDVSAQLHRLMSNWNEMSARWSQRMMMSSWGTAGGDFDSQVSSETTLSGADRFYTFPSTPELIADIEFWRQNPGQNFGWILIVEDSAVTAKRFASSEMGSPAFRPVLNVTFGPAVEDDDFAINYGLSGGWFNADTADQGLVLEVLPDSQQVFVAWFTYETDGAAKLGASEHRWLSGLGAIDGNRVEIDLRSTSGGLFDDSMDVDRTPSGEYGTLVLEFEDCATAVMTYNLIAEDMQGTRDLIRLAAPPQTCFDLPAAR